MMEASILCLSLAVSREAGGEPKPVQVAVVHVIRNRATAKHKPICQVVKEKRQFKLSRQKPNAALIKTARMAWRKKDTTGGATHFHDPRELPFWAKKMKRTAKIGKLRFYRK